jgi:hypothetical protein
MQNNRQKTKGDILWKIFITIVFIIFLAFVVPILGYIGMIAYFAYKDDTTYRYKHYRCDEKSFTVPLKLFRFRFKDTGTVYVEKDRPDPQYTDILGLYPPGSRFKFEALYSTYDFEGGTFYNYLVVDNSGKRSFLDFSDTDPVTCSYDTNNSYWFKNRKSYLPKEGKDAVKVPFNSLRHLFEEKQ